MLATAHLVRRSRTITETAIRKKYLRMESADDGNSLVRKSKTLNLLSRIMPMLDATRRAKESSRNENKFLALPGGSLNLGQHRTTTFADRRIRRVFTDMDRVVPAALALRTRRLAHLDLHAGVAVRRGRLLQYHVRNDEEVAQLVAMALQERIQGLGRCYMELRLEASADLLVGAGDLQNLQRLVADTQERRPFRNVLSGIESCRQTRLSVHCASGKSTRCTLSALHCGFGKKFPHFVRSEAHGRRHQAHERITQPPQRGLRRAPCQRLGADV